MDSPKHLRVCLLQLFAPSFYPEQMAWHRQFPPEQYVLHLSTNSAQLLHYIQQHVETIDCVILLGPAKDLQELQTCSHQLCELGILLPAVLAVVTDPGSPTQIVVQDLKEGQRFFYHTATVVQLVDLTQLPLHETADPEEVDLARQVGHAIALFLQLAPTCGVPKGIETNSGLSVPEIVRHQQQRLAEKLRERLGYLGVYYHRDWRRFSRNLPAHEQQSLKQRLRGLYQTIILEYFQSPAKVNSRIDEFVALAFFSDISVSQVLELHMSLMDDFAKQLKLEGRSEDILLDYRITLIDTIAHLAEMYRRSIPREN